MFPETEVIDWQVISRCTRKCKFCYGPIINEKKLNFNECKQLIDKFIALGCKVVGITGGEPLLHENIGSILEYIKFKGLKIGLNTNCDLYKNYRDLILKMVDALEIPLEAGNNKIHDSIRGNGSYSNILYALKDSYKNSNVIFRIGTVLFSENVNELPKIESVLSRFSDRIIYWKIYQYIAYSNKEMEKFFSCKATFEDAREKSWKRGLGSFLKTDQIIFDSAKMRNRSYFLVKPDGRVFVPLIEKGISIEKIIGNLLEENVLTIYNKWKSIIKVKNYKNCIRCIFRKANII